MSLKTIKIKISGVVQGVGFRPFVYRVAKKLNLNGSVSNTSEGVIIYINADEKKLNDFINIIKSEKPSNSIIKSIKIEYVEQREFNDFIIEKSLEGKSNDALIPVDLKICDDCIKDIFDFKGRRFLYPFTNCTNCGPRFSIIKKIPYDRKYTTMKKFKMCVDCKKEYENPLDRRFHAQPNACIKCGPKVWVVTFNGNIKEKDCFEYIAKRLISGNIVAIKGLGGFHLACDAFNLSSVKKLREFKKRDFKPFAIMVDEIDDIKDYVYISKKEIELLYSFSSPIVMLRKKNDDVFEYVSPMLDNVGVMIAYTPLHKILFYFLKKYNFKNPIVMTSGNLKDEPIVKDNDVALKVFKNFDIVLHNRDIYNRVDDSVVFVDDYENLRFIRRARGYVPSPIEVDVKINKTIFACGGDIKNHFSFYRDGFVFLSQYIGDLENSQNREFFIESYKSMKKLFKFSPEVCLIDKHPGYFSSEIGRKLFKKTISIQHHIAHIFSVMAENNLKDNVIGIAFDGTGFGDDGKIWGGEFFVVKDGEVKRVCHFKYFPLVGGDYSIKEVYRCFISFFANEKDFVYDVLYRKIDREKIDANFLMIKKNINTFYTSSVGRIFDAVGSLVLGETKSFFEGQIAMKLEHLAHKNPTDDFYDFDIYLENGIYIIDLYKMIFEIRNDFEKGNKKIIPSKFHNTIVFIIKKMIYILSKEYKIKNVCFSGGVFQNRYIVNMVQKTLTNYQVFLNSKTPSNDGCISLGQIYYYLVIAYLIPPMLYNKYSIGGNKK